MAIVRTQKRENPFVQIDKGIFEDPRISWKAKGVLGYLLSKPDNWTIVLNDIVNKSPDGLTVVRSALKELQENGYASLEIAREEKTGKLSGKVWVIFEEPKHRHTENTDVGENRLSGKPSFGKSHTSNNDFISNNRSIREKTRAKNLFDDVDSNTNLTEEKKKVAPKKNEPELDLHEYKPFIKALDNLPAYDDPRARVDAWNLFKEHIKGEYFLSNWEFLSDGVPSGADMERVMKDWVSMAPWIQVRNAQYNKIKNWIRNDSKNNQSNGKSNGIISKETIVRVNRRLVDEGY